MATPKVFKPVAGATWVDVAGAAAGVTGVTWQNVGNHNLEIAFTTSAPAEGPTDAFHTLGRYQAFYDKNGSPHCWVRCKEASTLITATAD